MFQRIRKAWKLSKIHDFDDNGVLNLYSDDIENGLVRPLVTKRSILPKNIDAILGDGNAEFFGEGTEQEFLDQERADVGLKAWYDRIKQ